MTNRNLRLIKELDFRVEKLKDKLSRDQRIDPDTKSKIIDEIINLSEEKVLI